MATPTLGTINLVEISTAETTTNWNFTSIALDNELFKEGSNSVYGLMRNDLAVAEFSDATARTTAGRHLRCWMNFTAFSLLDIEANGGMEIYVSDGTNTDYVTAFGGDTYTGGWFNLVIDGAQFTTVTAANVDTWGWRFNRTAAPRNVDNTWIDYFRYMDGYSATGGTSGDKINLAGIAAQDALAANGYGVVLLSEGVFFGYGEIQIGSGATTTWFEMDGDVLSFADAPVAANFFQFNGNGSGTDISITDSVFQSAGTGTNNKFVFDMSDTNITLSMTGTVLQRGAAISFASGQTVTDNTFNNCGQITHGGATMNGSVVKNYEGTAGTGAIIYNVNVDPDGEMDNMSIIKGTAATHAIEFGTNTPTTITLTGIDFSGYNALDGNNDSTLLFPDTGTDTTWTVNNSGCTGNLTYRKARAGDTVNIEASVGVTVTVKDQSGTAVQNAQTAVYLTSDRTQILNADTNASGIASGSYSGTTPAECEVRVRKGSSGATRYVPYSSIQTISGTGLSLNVTLREDANNNATS